MVEECHPEFLFQVPGKMRNRQEGSPLDFRRMDASRILCFGGIFLIIAGMFLGEIYAIFISHAANAEIKRGWISVVEAVTSRNPEAVRQQFTVIEELTTQKGRTTNTHSHIGAYGYLALVLMLLQPAVGWSKGQKRLLALIVIAGSLIQALGVYASLYAGLWAHYVSDTGAVLVIIGLAGNLFGLAIRRSDKKTFNARIIGSLESGSSLFLLKAGGLLILMGMLFGFYYAWVFVTQDEVRQAQKMSRALGSSVQRSVGEAKQAISDYRATQSKIGITAAAHSHAIELGTLAILLAFVQDFILIDERWKIRWAGVFTAGSFLLPAFVFLATRYGLVPAAFADLSGILVILALSSMAFGVIRCAGARDVLEDRKDSER